MAADLILLKNLTKTIRENESLLHATVSLENFTRSVTRAVNAAVEEGNAVASQQEINLRNLRDQLLYQADDLLDEILTFKVNADNRIRRMVNLRCKISREAKRISQQIEEVMLQLRYGPEIADQLPPPEPESIEQPENEGEFELAEYKVIGRDSDRKNIIKMLLRPKTQISTNVSIIPIVGKPGVGKSTLAKYVYDDVKVDSHFDLKIWIPVSQITGVAEIVQEIVESCTNRRFNDNRSSRVANIPQSRFFGLLGCQSFDGSDIGPSGSSRKIENDTSISEHRLRKVIEGKIFLLILDDANLDDANEPILLWQPLKDLLDGSARGSHILVTTRSPEIANLSKTQGVEPYLLKGLEERYHWTLFQTFAFGKKGGPDKFKQAGDKIAKKCKGVPLTMKVAASLLYRKTREEWGSFYEQMLSLEEERIMDYVLEKSYTSLPTHLMACFGYCSLFPDDFIFNKHDLISLWIAQGYVEQQEDQNLKDVAEKYFLELSRRCFFEDVTTDALGNIKTCKMHHIMHSLAHKQTAGVVNMFVEDPCVDQDLNSACKHVSFTCVGYSPTKISPSLLKAQNLRTLLSVKEPDCDTKMNPLVCHMLISSFKCLRVLDLHDLGIDEFPVTVSKLIHLRYLDLSKNGMVTLPKSITELYNLQTLKLNSCMKLTRFLGNFGKLVNLKRFEIDECDNLTCMPLGLERLTQLETLSRFVVNKGCSAELEILRELVTLRGRLAIELSGDWAANIPEAPQAETQRRILQAECLDELNISWTKTASDQSSYLQLLEHLKPNLKLKILCIEGYRGDKFPRWAQRNMLACLPKLVVVSIEGCDKCKHLPPFGKLQFLKKLTLRHMANVKYVEGETSQELQEGSQETTSESSLFFPSLEELTLHNFYKLKRWQKEVVVTSRQQVAIRSFPCLSKLRIWNCPNLRSMPLFKEVLDLDLHNVNQMLLKECSEKASEAKWNNSRIEHLQIKGCRNLTSFKVVRKGLGGLPSLKKLEVERCDALNSLTSELKHLTSLERLEISSCIKLNLSDDGISDTATGNADTVSWISNRIGHQLNRISTPWASLKCLRHLNLREIPEMETLPEGLKHVSSLRSLWISACPALTVLPDWIGSLTALQHLQIVSCHSLQTLPDGLREVKSLIKVEIIECPELLERCREHTGADWHKIKHAQVFLHKSWRYGLMPEQGAPQNRSNVRALTDVKYFIIPVITAEGLV